MFNVLQEKNSEANGCSKPLHLSSMDPAMRNEGNETQSDGKSLRILFVQPNIS
jgi:hypothetical protein